MKNTFSKHSVKWIAVIGMFMAIVIILSMSIFSIPVPGGHLYVNDIAICTASIILDPLGAFLACGVGAFLGDAIFYPAPMLVSLVTHGLQAVVISLCTRKLKMKKSVASAIGVTLGAIIMVIGYTLGRIFVYTKSVEVAIIKLPYEILQAGLGAVVGMILCYPCHLIDAFHKILGKEVK